MEAIAKMRRERIMREVKLRDVERVVSLFERRKAWFFSFKISIASWIVKNSSA